MKEITRRTKAEIIAESARQLGPEGGAIFVHSEDQRQEHITDGQCWCEPEIVILEPQADE